MTKKIKFIQTVPIKYYGNHGMRPMTDCIALTSNIADDLGYDSKIISLLSVKGTAQAIKTDNNLNKKVKILYPKNNIELISLLLKEKPEIVFGNARTISGFITCFFGKYKIFMSHQSQNPESLWKRVIFKFFVKRFDILKVETPYAKQELIDLGINPDKIRYIPIPIDYKFFEKKPTTIEKKTLKQKYNLKDDELIIFILCHIRSHKKVYTMINAAKILCHKNKKIKFVFVGTDLLKEEGLPSLKEKATELGIADNVIVTGRIPENELRNLMHISVIGLQSSTIEGQCLSIYEMAASGLPLCLSSIGSFTSVFGKCALFHDPDDHVKLAQNIELYLKNKELRYKNSQLAKKEVISRCNYKKIVSEMRKLLSFKQ